MSAEVVPVKQGCCSFTQHILKENNFVCVRYWLNELTGKKIEDFERFTLQSRLAGCAERTGFANVNQFVEYLGEQTYDFSQPCWQRLIDAALETDSWFRREARHFNFLQQIVLPELDSDCRILSAGCGAGEEAFDIAFECASRFGTKTNWRVEGIDVRSEAIESAKMAYWEAEDCALISHDYQEQYFEPFHQGFRVVEEIRNKTRFGCANLLHKGNGQLYDVVFCRNLLMDMEKRCAQILIDNMMQRLKSGGYLIVSHNETLADFIASDSLLSPHIAKKP